MALRMHAPLRVCRAPALQGAATLCAAAPRAARRSLQAPRAELRLSAPSPTQIDGLLGVALAPFALVATSSVFEAALSSSATSVAAALTLTPSVPLALSVLFGGIVTLERDALLAASAGPVGAVFRAAAALGAVAAAVATVNLQLPLLAAIFASKPVVALLAPSVPMALSVLAAGLVLLEGGPVLASLSAKARAEPGGTHAMRPRAEGTS
jgi:hypothetical protein